MPGIDARAARRDLVSGAHPRAPWQVWYIPLAAAAFGFAMFAISVGLSLVNPRKIGWLLYGGDPEEHFLGWHLFRGGPWSSPVGATPHLMWPSGTSIGLTDSIPLFALAFKPFAAYLSAEFQYQGLWLLCCFVLQGLFAALLMRAVTPRGDLQLLGACLFVMSSPMLHRYIHEALAAHWVILWSLSLSLAAGARPPFAPWLLVSSVTAAIHPYLAVMVGALMAAAHARELMLTPSKWIGGLGRFAAIAGSVALILWQCGYFVIRGQSLQGEKFGQFSMNLLSPFVSPQAYATSNGWFTPATDGQYEGSIYFGAGLLLLMGVAVVTSRRWLAHAAITRSQLLERLPLVGAMLVLLMLALGPTLTIGPWTLFSYDAKWWGPLTLFRANGRMAWPAYYAAVLLLISVAVRLDGRRALVVLCAAVLLQGWDLSASYGELRRMRTAGFATPLRSRFWEAAPRSYERFIVYPSPMCTAEATFDFRPFALLAGRHGMAINTGRAARWDTVRVDDYCRTLDREIGTGAIDSRSLYVLREDLAPTFLATTGPAAVCFRIDDHDVCVARATIVKWPDDFDVMFTVLPPLDEVLAFDDVLDAEYRTRLGRAARPVARPAAERLITLMRYLWYRRGGCSDQEAGDTVLTPADRQPRICGDPFRGRTWPSAAEAFALRQRMEEVSRERPASERQVTHVDPEGEAVWIQQYVAERLNGREPVAARDVVLGRIRAAVAPP